MPERDVSEFNNSIGYLNRLNLWFFSCEEASFELDANRWFNALLSLAKCLSTEFKEDEIPLISKFQTKVLPMISKHNQKITDTGLNEINPELYKLLFDFDLKLRYICKKAGLQQKLKNDPGQAIDE